MYAVFKLSGLQYSVSEGEVVKIPSLQASKGDKLSISEILLLKDDDRTLVGAPYVADARIEAEVTEQGKNDKVLIYKYKRRTKYRRTQGHRQDYCEIKINKIVAPKN